jgi:hypothetical protein
VDHVVDPAIAGPGEPMAVLLTGRGIQGSGAGPGSEPVAVGEPSDVTDVGQDPRSHDSADTVDLHEV